MPKNIYIIDFDQTFTINPTGGFRVFENEEEKQKYINEFISTNIRNLLKISLLFTRIVDEGHEIAIASFAQKFSAKQVKRLEKYKHLDLKDENILGGKDLILAYLDVAFGKDRPFLQADDIQAFFPEYILNKNEHIEKIIKRYNRANFMDPITQKDNKKVMLIDDELKNIEAAQQKGFRTIHVTHDDSYLALLEADLNSFKFAPVVPVFTETARDVLKSEYCAPPRFVCN